MIDDDLPNYENLPSNDERMVLAQRFSDAFERVCPTYLGGYLPERIVEALELADLQLIAVAE